MTPTVIDGTEGLRRLCGSHLGYSDWIEISQERIAGFADVTGDHQWLHVDVARAASGPFGRTIAHGLLTLSLIPGLQRAIYDLQGISRSVNYGADRVRFPSPVLEGAQVRLGAELAGLVDVDAGVVQANWRFTIEIKDTSKPACVADLIFRYYA